MQFEKYSVNDQIFCYNDCVILNEKYPESLQREKIMGWNFLIIRVFALTVSGYGNEA